MNIRSIIQPPVDGTIDANRSTSRFQLVVNQVWICTEKTLAVVEIRSSLLILLENRAFRGSINLSSLMADGILDTHKQSQRSG